MAESGITVGLLASVCADRHTRQSPAFVVLLMDLLRITDFLRWFLRREGVQQGSHVPVNGFEVVAKCSLQRWCILRNFMLVCYFNVNFLWGFCLFGFGSSGDGVWGGESLQEWKGIVYFSFLPQKELTSSSPLWLNNTLSKARSWSWWSVTCTLGSNRPKVFFHICFWRHAPFKINPQMILPFLVEGGEMGFSFFQNSGTATCCHLLSVTKHRVQCWQREICEEIQPNSAKWQLEGNELL